jgi:hypothetical protein
MNVGRNFLGMTLENQVEKKRVEREREVLLTIKK